MGYGEGAMADNCFVLPFHINLIAELMVFLNQIGIFQ